MEWVVWIWDLVIWAFDSVCKGILVLLLIMMNWMEMEESTNQRKPIYFRYISINLYAHIS